MCTINFKLILMLLMMMGLFDNESIYFGYLFEEFDLFLWGFFLVDRFDIYIRNELHRAQTSSNCLMENEWLLALLDDDV